MNEQEQPIRIAVVDDHEMFRAGVIATLQPPVSYTHLTLPTTPYV